MYVARVRLTKHYKHRKNENKIKFEEDPRARAATL